MNASERARLSTFGFTDADIEALDHLWASPALEHLLNLPAEHLREHGYGPADAVDVVLHDTTAQLAVPLLDAGFTVHQAAVVLHSVEARANLDLQKLFTERFHPLLYTDAPIKYVVDVLLTAKRHKEATDLLGQWTQAANGAPRQAGDTPESLEAAVGSVAALGGYYPNLDCPCP